MKPGTKILFTGFGVTSAGTNDAGVRRIGTSIIASIGPDTFAAVDNAPDTCYGDSGGPVFAQVDTGGWRVVGLVSRGPEDCSGGGTYTRVDRTICWLETKTSVDFSPGTDCGGNASATEAAKTAANSAKNADPQYNFEKLPGLVTLAGARQACSALPRVLPTAADINDLAVAAQQNSTLLSRLGFQGSGSHEVWFGLTQSGIAEVYDLLLGGSGVQHAVSATEKHEAVCGRLF